MNLDSSAQGLTDPAYEETPVEREEFYRDNIKLVKTNQRVFRPVKGSKEIIEGYAYICELDCTSKTNAKWTDDVAENLAEQFIATIQYVLDNGGILHPIVNLTGRKINELPNFNRIMT